jgi:hypothetical protein
MLRRASRNSIDAMEKDLSQMAEVQDLAP